MSRNAFPQIEREQAERDAQREHARMERAQVSTDLLPPPAVAARYSMTPESLANWRREGKGPRWIRLGDGKRPRVMYRMADVIEWENQRVKEQS